MADAGRCGEILLLNRSDNDNGHLFVFEGIDGGGKSTVCMAIADMLKQRGFDVVVLSEPTSESRWGREIRRRSPSGELSPAEELDLFIRDREWHVKNRILPALADGRTVLMDRYFFATGAYQSVSTGVSWQEILKINRERIGAPEPDIVFILDLPAEVGLDRAVRRKGKANVQFERLERLVRVREAYLAMVRDDAANYVVIDATRPLDSVISAVYNRIIGFLHGLEGNEGSEPSRTD